LTPAESRPNIHAMTAREVAAIRDELGLTQAEFAALLRTSQSAVSQWETGATRVSGPVSELIRMKHAEARARPTAVA
jgi:DNA-binding transcriptional regulator YiaG